MTNTINTYQEGSFLCLDDDNQHFISQKLSKKGILFFPQVFEIQPSVPFLFVYPEQNRESIRTVNQILRRKYKKNFYYWKDKKQFCCPLKIGFKIDEDSRNQIFFPIFTSIEKLEAFKVFFDVRMNFESFYGFDIYIDSNDLITIGDQIEILD